MMGPVKPKIMKDFRKAVVMNMKAWIIIVHIFCFGATSVYSSDPEMDVEMARAKVFEPNDKESTRAFEVLKKYGDKNTLIKVVAGSKRLKLRIAAIGTLAEIGDINDAKYLISILEPINVDVVEGGSEQQVGNKKTRGALVNAIACILRVQPPEEIKEKEVANFISACKIRMERVRDKDDTQQVIGAASQQPTNQTAVRVQQITGTGKTNDLGTVGNAGKP